MSRNITKIASMEEADKRKGGFTRSGQLVTEIFDDELFNNETETTIELNFAVLKLKHTVKQNKSARNKKNNLGKT